MIGAISALPVIPTAIAGANPAAMPANMLIITAPPCLIASASLCQSSRGIRRLSQRPSMLKQNVYASGMRYIQTMSMIPGFSPMTISVEVIIMLGIESISVTLSLEASHSRAETGMLLMIQRDFPSIEIALAVVTPIETIQPITNGTSAGRDGISGSSRNVSTSSALTSSAMPAAIIIT